MKLILFEIFNIIDFKLILSKNLKPSDIFKGGNSEKNFNSKNKTQPVISINEIAEIDSGSPGETSNDMSNEIKDMEIPSQNDLKLEKLVLFMASCLKAGLTSDNHILDAYEWAPQNIGFLFFK